MFDIPGPADTSPFYDRFSKVVQDLDNDARKSMLADFFKDYPSPRDRDDFIAQVVWNQNPLIVSTLFDYFKTIDIQFETSYYGETTVLLFALNYQKYIFANYLCNFAVRKSISEKSLKHVAGIFIKDNAKEYFEKVNFYLNALPSQNPSAELSSFLSKILKLKEILFKKILEPHTPQATAISSGDFLSPPPPLPPLFSYQPKTPVAAKNPNPKRRAMSPIPEEPTLKIPKGPVFCNQLGGEDITATIGSLPFLYLFPELPLHEMSSRYREIVKQAIIKEDLVVKAPVYK